MHKTCFVQVKLCSCVFAHEVIKLWVALIGGGVCSVIGIMLGHDAEALMRRADCVFSKHHGRNIAPIGSILNVHVWNQYVTSQACDQSNGCFMGRETLHGTSQLLQLMHIELMLGHLDT